jgi:hypothetical protein
MRDLRQEYAEALSCLQEAVDAQLAESPTRPFALLRWQQLSDCGVPEADHRALCKETLGGYLASDACFIVRAQWTRR